MTDEQTIHSAYEAWSRRDIDALLELVHPDVLVIGVGHVYRAGPEQERRPPVVEQRDVGGVGEHRRLEAGTRLEPDGRHLEHFLDHGSAVDRRREHGADVVVRPDGTEQDFGGRLGRNHVRGDAAGDQADRVMGPSQHRVVRPRSRAQVDQDVHEPFDRRAPQFRIA